VGGVREGTGIEGKVGFVNGRWRGFDGDTQLVGLQVEGNSDVRLVRMRTVDSILMAFPSDGNE
jgi:hypothetical protein